MAYFIGNTYFDNKTDIYCFVGIKSIGKTTWGWNSAIDDYEKNEKGFGWIFNSETELKKFKTELHSLIDPKKYRIIGFNIWDIVKDRIFGVLGSINTQTQVKNLQIADKLFYDEVENGTGMGSMDEKFVKFIKIVSNLERKKDIHFKVYAFMNAESKNNVIFEGLKIKLPDEIEFKSYDYNIFGDKNLKVVMLDDEKYFNKVERKKSLAFAMTQSNKKANEMIFHNKFSYDDDRMISDKFNVPVKKYLFNIGLDLENYTAYLDEKNNMIIDYQHENTGKIRFHNLTNLDLYYNSGNNTDNEDIIELIENRIRKTSILFMSYNIKESIITYLITKGFQYE